MDVYASQTAINAPTERLGHTATLSSTVTVVVHKRTHISNCRQINNTLILDWEVLGH